MKSRLTALMLAITIGLSGCAWVNALTSNEELFESSVRIATGRVLMNRPEWAPETRKITGEALGWVDSEAHTSVDDVEDYVMTQVPWQKLLPEEQEILRRLIVAASDKIKQRATEQGISDPGELEIRIVDVLTWINDTAQRY